MSDNVFTTLMGETCLLVSNGVYQQADVYRLGNDLFAGKGSRFYRLYKSGATSHPGTRFDRLTLSERQLSTDQFGRLQITR